MKIKVSQAQGLALDWMVARCIGVPKRELFIQKWSGSLFRRNLDEDGNLNGAYTTGPDLLFSRKWEAGGKVIEKMLASPEALVIEHTQRADPEQRYVASLNRLHRFCFGPTPIIAAMRCFVSSRMGDEVEVPDEVQ